MDDTQSTQISEVYEENRDDIPEHSAWGAIHTTNPLLPNYEITEEEISIGRRSTCTVVVPDKRISSLHCKIYRNIGSSSETYLEDLRFGFLMSTVQLSQQYEWNISK